MKKLTFVLLTAFVLVLALSSAAVAIEGDSSWLPASGSPHGAYDTNTVKCRVCHALHQADATGEVLLQGTVADACTYCHISTFAGKIRVYNGVSGNYTTAGNKAHDSAGGATCVNCHQVHGATSQMFNHAYLREKILKSGPIQGGVTVNAGDANDVAVSKYCTRCHGATSDYYETAYDTGAQTSHVMVAGDLSDYGDAAGNGVGTFDGQVAWTGSETCVACHADGVRNQSDGTNKILASSYPHFTAGARFLTSAADAGNVGAMVPAANGSADGVCIRCHVSGAAGAGVNY